MCLSEVGHVAARDAQRQPFNNRSLAHAGVAQQHRIILAAPAEHLHGAPDLFVAADHRIELAEDRIRSKVAPEAVQRAGRRVAGEAGGAQVAAQRVEHLADPLARHVERHPQRAVRPSRFYQRQQEMLAGNQPLSRAPRLALGILQHLLEAQAERRLYVGTGDFGQTLELGFDLLAQLVDTGAGAAQHLGHQPFALT